MSFNVNCPMPGKINKVNAQVGAHVQANETLFVLESMKMEVNVAAPKAGKIAAINARTGDSVKKGMLLAVIE